MEILGLRTWETLGSFWVLKWLISSKEYMYVRDIMPWNYLLMHVSWVVNQ